MDKPPVLSDEKIWARAREELDAKCPEDVPVAYYKACQRDADWELFKQEPRYTTVPEVVIKTRQETAREIFKEIDLGLSMVMEEKDNWIMFDKFSWEVYYQALKDKFMEK